MNEKILIPASNNITTIEKVKVGEYFRFPGKNVVYVRDKYNASLRRYEFYRADDISALQLRKRGAYVEINFLF